MARATRIVQRLHLRAGSESAVRRALPALEDAFRTAMLPDAGARLVFVRRLSLGALPRGASAQSLSLLLASRFTEAGQGLVHAADAPPDTDLAVWFRDSLQAHELAALQVAAGRFLTAWFWPLAVPALAGATTHDDRLRAIAFSLAAQEEAPAALPAWTASLVRAGYRERLLGALRPGDGHGLLRAARASQMPFERARTAPGRAHGAPDVRLTDGTPDDREVFVEVMIDRASGPTTREPVSVVERTARQSRAETLGAAPRPHVDAQAHRARETPRPLAGRRTIERESLTSPARRGESAADPLADVDNAQATEAPSSAVVAGRRLERHSSPPHAARDARHAPPAARARSPVDVDEAPASPWRRPDAAPTAAGGLPFLVPVLERVGFASWSAQRGPEEPEPEILAAQILHLLLSRLRLDEDDPAWALAGAFRLTPEATGELSELRGLAIESEDASGLRGFRLQPEGNAGAHLWLTACRRFLRRHVRIGLASLVLRPARLAITNTHVDVFFRLNAVDLRIRRAGLDIDPGWVPWFARVVTFHYEDRPWQ